MNSAFEAIREYAVYGLSVLRRRWLYFCVPVALTILLASFAVQLAPKKYVAKSLILLQGANRSAMGFGAQGGHANAIEQVRAIEAWAKSDQVLSEILPRISDGPKPLSPGELFVAMRALRASLTFELVSNAALEVTLEGKESSGLGHKLEIILARIMEGLTGPERSILSAQQFMLLRYEEQVKATEAALHSAIEAAGLENSPEVRSALGELAAMSSGRPTPGTETAVWPRPDEAGLRAAISDDPDTVRRLVALYSANQAASDDFSALQAQAGTGRSNYVGIFDSPDNLLIIGRPKDPIAGESSARKLAMLAVLLAITGSGAAIVLLELMSGVLRTRGEYESASGIPVVARLARCKSEAGAQSPG